MTPPLYFSSMNFLTSGDVIAALSFWNAGFVSSPGRTTTMLTKGDEEGSIAIESLIGLRPAWSAKFALMTAAATSLSASGT